MHPTQIFLANPRALRVEYRLNDQCLELWWSPGAGESTDCADRSYSSRDAHLSVFAAIHLPGCDLPRFQSCDYDPYHCVLHFSHRTLHIALPVDVPAVLLWSDQPLTVDFRTARFDTVLHRADDQFVVEHPEPRHTFRFAATLPPGGGHFRHSHLRPAEFPAYARAELHAGQSLAIGTGLHTEALLASLRALVAAPPEALLDRVNQTLAPSLASGRTRSRRHPGLDALRDSVLRGLHSMIDDSGTFRASLKPIYYLVWVRDSGFSFLYQAAAGWPHKLPEFCRFLLANPTTVDEAGLPRGRMFGQLIHRHLGKLEEDGFYYAVASLFTHWTQFGHLDFLNDADQALLDEALAWVEAVTWDPDRGLFGEHFADETATAGHRDHGWDQAIGQPAGDNALRHEGRPVVRNYDVYFNTCMHSAYCMLAAMRGDPGLLQRAEALWPALRDLLQERHDGLPVYGELLLDDGRRVRPPSWGPPAGASCCVWGLSLPNFLPLADADSVRAALLDALIAKPEMHFINGICSAIAAADPWCYPEERLLELHRRLAEETAKPGTFLPMGGAMPEKFNAPQGNLYHDIRPQGFAMGTWLAAWSGLALRRLPYGLALRPASAIDEIHSYPWRGKTLHFHFGPSGRALALDIDGTLITGTLQIPESALRDGSHIRLVAHEPAPLLLRSSCRLERCGPGPVYDLHAFGLSRLSFSEPLANLTLTDAAGEELPFTSFAADGLFHVDFTHMGPLRLSAAAEA